MTSPTQPRARGRWTSLAVRGLQRLVVVSAYGYPLILIAFCAAFVLLGEAWWVTAGLLFVPRVLFGAPLVLLVPALLLLGRRRLLWTQAVALVLTLFPLMGMVLPWPVRGAEQAPSFKLMSFNIDATHGGDVRLLSVVDSAAPDLVLFQESSWGGQLLDDLRSRFPHVESSTQFVVASRFPILDRTDPARILHYGRERSPRFMRYLIETNLGKVAVYNLHPLSPRGTLGISRLRDVFHNVRTGNVLERDAESELGQNAELRAKQIAAAAEMASKEPYPVLLAGDTNLPGLSATLHRHLSGYSDAFRQASWGFGYTFPRRYPFLRLDRMLAGPELRFSEFQVGCPDVSDHLCMIACVIAR